MIQTEDKPIVPKDLTIPLDRPETSDTKRKYELLDFVEYEPWQAFNLTSEQGSIFTDRDFLNALPGPVKFYGIWKGLELVAMFPTFAGQDSGSLDHVDFNPHHPILFAPRKENQSVSRYHAEIYKITEFCLYEFFSKYNKVKIYFHPQSPDLRPFLWYNYHSQNANEKFRVDLRYTTYLDISQSEDHMLESVSPLRRRLIRSGTDAGFYTREAFDKVALLKLYKLTMSHLTQMQYDSVIRISEQLYSQGKAKMFMTYDRFDMPAFCAVYLLDSRRAYYLFGACDPAHKGNASGTLVHWAAFNSLRSDGLTEVDLVGVNSPNRGAFKLSFGGRLIPYYELILDRS